MARTLPSGIQDQTASIMARSAAADDALARMYIMLHAKRQDRDRMEALRREMASDADRRWYDRYDYAHAGAAPDPNNPLAPSPGAAAYTPSGNAAPAPTVAPIGKALQGDTAEPLSSDTFRPAGNNGKVSSNSAADDPMNAQAQASVDDISSAPRGTGGARARNTAGPTLTGLPRQPKKAAPQAAYLPISDHILSSWRNAEKQNGLPQGTLLTLLGTENSGGRFYGTNPRSTATGWFQFTKALQDKFHINAADTQDPVLMGNLAARNMADNRDTLHRLTSTTNKIVLGNSVNDIPYYTILHQFGPGDGPRIVAALKVNPNVRMTDAMMSNLKNADGTPRDNGRVLINNNIPSDATVGQFYGIHHKRIAPWMNDSVLTEGRQPQAQAQTQTQAQAQQQPPRPPGDIPPQQQGTMGSNPRLVAAIRGGASLALPEGYTIRQTSGHRPGDSGYHGRQQAADFQIYTPDGRAIPNRGEDTTGLYTRMARGVKTWIAENDPSFRVNYGGAHGTQKSGGGVPDLMHYDTGPDRGNMRPDVRMSRLQPLGANERNAAPQQVAQQVPTDVSAQRQLPTRTPMKGAGKTYEDQSGMYDFKPSPTLATQKNLADAIFAPSGGIKSNTQAAAVASNVSAKQAPAAIVTQTPPAGIRPDASMARLFDDDGNANAMTMPPPMQEMPMPPARPGEGGDLSDTAPKDVPLPQAKPTPAPPFGSDADAPYDNSGEVYNAPTPDAQEPLTPAQLAQTTAPIAKPLMPDEFASGPASPPSVGYVKPVDTPVEMTTPLPPLPANSYGERRAAVLRGSQPQSYALSREPPQLPDLGQQSGIQRILPPELAPTPATPTPTPVTPATPTPSAQSLLAAIYGGGQRPLPSQLPQQLPKMTERFGDDAQTPAVAVGDRPAFERNAATILNNMNIDMTPPAKPGSGHDLALMKQMLAAAKDAIFSNKRNATAAAPPAKVDPNAPLVPKKVRTIGPNEDTSLQPFKINPAAKASTGVTGTPFVIQNGKAVMPSGAALPPPPTPGSGGNRPIKVPDPTAPGGFRYRVPDEPTVVQEPQEVD